MTGLGVAGEVAQGAVVRAGLRVGGHVGQAWFHVERGSRWRAAWLGTEGMAGEGWRDLERHRVDWQAWRRMADKGTPRRGMVGQAWPREAGAGETTQGNAWQARRGLVWRDLNGVGLAWGAGVVRQRVASRVRDWRERGRQGIGRQDVSSIVES